jgi:HTH-type transcriptional regulator/antitoxin HigA
MIENVYFMDDFVVPSVGEHVDAREMFDDFKIIKSLFNNPEFSKSEIVERGWIKNKNDFASFYSLISKAKVNDNAKLYRKAENSNYTKCLIWMAKINKTAELFLAMTNVPRFSGIDAGFLSDLAKLSVDETIPVNLPHILAERGIILIYEHSLPGMKLDGVVFRLKSGHPVIGMSFRYSRLDYFWFTLMHELAHIHLHLDRLDEPIFDDLEEEGSDTTEVQANRLAKSSFIPRSIWRNCAPKYHKSDEVLIDFSREMGVHPAIVAGMLRKEANSYAMYNSIVNKINVRDMVFNND